MVDTPGGGQSAHIRVLPQFSQAAIDLLSHERCGGASTKIGPILFLRARRDRRDQGEHEAQAVDCNLHSSMQAEKSGGIQCLEETWSE